MKENFKLRFNNDIPVQSKSTPLLSIYMLICMVYTLFGMIWFALLNVLKDKKKLSNKLQYFLVYYVAKLFSKKNTQHSLNDTFKHFLILDEDQNKKDIIKKVNSEDKINVDNT